jgi:ATP-dependent protease ClpP protease subunit
MAKLNIEGTIGESDGFMEMFGGESDTFSAKDMRKFLEDNIADDAHEIEIRSFGGSVDIGIDIYEQLRNSGKKITTIAYECASIATVIFLAGDTRKVSKHSAPLIHNPWIDGWALSGMTADDLAALSDELRLAEDRILNIYVERTGFNREELSSIMGKDQAITSDEFLRLGFATEIINGEQTKAHKAFAYIKAHQNKTMDKTKIESWFNKIENMIANLGKKTILNLAVPMKDTTTLYVKTEGTEYMVNDEVYTDEAYTTPAPDGEHETEGGKILVVVAGIITEIKDAIMLDEKDTKIAELEAKVAELEAAKALAETAKATADAKVTSITKAKADQENAMTAIKAQMAEFKALLEADPITPQRELTKAEKELEARRKLRGYGKSN